MDTLIRTQMLIGEEGLNKLKNSNIIIFGVGGVGSFCMEAIARCGVGTIHLVDDDKVSESNINRQLIATHSSVGKDKVEVAKNRILDINKDANVLISKIFYTKETKDLIDLSKYDYIIDAIDTISSKILLIEMAKELDVPIISCMGTGNKLDPSQFSITDIYKTSVCPLAKVMRYELKKRGIKKLNVLYSKELPKKPLSLDVKEENIHQKRQTPASISFVPSVAGLMIAGYVINDILKR